MNLVDSICKFMDNAQSKSENEQNNKIETQSELLQEDKPAYGLNPRDGMSFESAKLAIFRCGDNSQFEINHIENKGRYFIAKVMDSKGNQVNEILVDKQNGSVRFLRS
jgi:hypothetical protein